jgi:hypothetical protein
MTSVIAIDFGTSRTKAEVELVPEPVAAAQA